MNQCSCQDVWASAQVASPVQEFWTCPTGRLTGKDPQQTGITFPIWPGMPQDPPKGAGGHTELGRSAFCHCAPHTWNMFQQNIKLTSLRQFQGLIANLVDHNCHSF